MFLRGMYKIDFPDAALFEVLVGHCAPHRRPCAVVVAACGCGSTSACSRCMPPHNYSHHLLLLLLRRRRRCLLLASRRSGELFLYET